MELRSVSQESSKPDIDNAKNNTVTANLVRAAEQGTWESEIHRVQLEENEEDEEGKSRSYKNGENWIKCDENLVDLSQFLAIMFFI